MSIFLATQPFWFFLIVPMNFFTLFPFSEESHASSSFIEALCTLPPSPATHTIQILFIHAICAKRIFLLQMPLSFHHGSCRSGKVGGKAYSATQKFCLNKVAWGETQTSSLRKGTHTHTLIKVAHWLWKEGRKKGDVSLFVKKAVCPFLVVCDYLKN